MRGTELVDATASVNREVAGSAMLLSQGARQAIEMRAHTEPDAGTPPHDRRLLQFEVKGSVPPKKDGATSVWRKASGIAQLKALRVAAVAQLPPGAPFDRPVRLVLRLYVPAPEGEPSLWIRRQHGDLENFITGLCDGLQAADGRAYDDSTVWADIPPAAHPSRAIAFTDDSWVRRIEAELISSSSERVGYEVEVEPL